MYENEIPEPPQEYNRFYGNINGADTISTNQGYNSALQIRLNPQDLLSDINDLLSGTVTYKDYDENGNPVTKKQVTGEAFANRIGIQAIMSFCVLEINPHGVQGNYTDERYNLDRKFSREELSFLIALNRYEWEINPKKMELVVDRIISLVKKFSSRTLYNKERESYATTLQSKETHQIVPNENKKMMGF